MIIFVVKSNSAILYNYNDISVEINRIVTFSLSNIVLIISVITVISLIHPSQVKPYVNPLAYQQKSYK